MTYDLDNVLEMVRQLRVMTVGNAKSPHKYLFLLTLASLYERDSRRKNEFPLNQELEHAFLNVCKEIYPTNAPEAILIEFPYYHLVKDKVWSLVFLEGKEQEFRDYEDSSNMRLTRKRLINTINHGYLCAEMDSCLRDPCGRVAVVRELRHLLHDILNPHVQKSPQKSAFARLQFAPHYTGSGNPFVSYLNSLQRLNASNENALAEYQACNPFFAYIHVPHRLTKTIVAELQNPQGRQVILTGHAGDGKTTISLDVYKQLAGIPAGEPLKRPLAAREDLPATNITIFKDLSERRKDEDAALMQELLGGRRRFLIISNTGALLDLFCAQASAFGVSSVQLASNVLDAIGNERGEVDLDLKGTRFLVVNLARMDNLDLSRQIFARMLASERWAVCEGLPCRVSCPICLNVDLINHHRDVVLDRLFLAYRRMYEYGTRLTLRQLTEHLAYLVTSGLEEIDIAEMREKRLNPLKVEFMFFNRFFGDNGKVDHPAAMQMRAVCEIRKQAFGERPCPTWERKLWLKLRDRNFRLCVADCDAEFELLRDYGSGPGNDNQPGLTPDQAREQVRRMLFFLYDFPKEEQSFLKQFLNSPTLLRWQEWQKQGARLEMTEKNVLEQRIYHVLQEHFTGVRLPEGAIGHDRRLYITLSRGMREIRQSAQVVLAQIDWSNETALELATRQNAVGGVRTDLELQGRGRISGVNLMLTLPFLDYVVMRHFGELGEILQASYVERLERFKAQVQKHAREARSDVMLVRLKTDHTFRRQQYTVRDRKLEVNDVL
jgi:hypothetical protein